MSTKTHYQILEVSRDAAERELKRAYHKLAKRYHPDKATSGDEAQEFERQMALVSQAYNILKDPKRRDEYDSQLKKEKTNAAQIGTASASDKSEAYQRRATIAAKALAKGVQLMKAGDSKRAIEFLEAAVENNPEEPLAHAKLAEALIDCKKGFSRATEHAQKAIELDPWNTKLRLILGRIYEEAGVKSRAIAVYEEALKFDEENALIRGKLGELRGGGVAGAKSSLTAMVNRLLGRKG